MAEFAKYYIDFLTRLFYNTQIYFRDRWTPVANIFVIDIKDYIAELTAASTEFGFAGWLLFIFVLLNNVALIFFISYRVFQLLRRYILFRAKEVEKDELVEEIAKLHNDVAKLTMEKNQLYALKVNSMYPGMNPLEEKAEEVAATVELATRFHKLTTIDKKYEVPRPYESTVETEGITLKQIVDNFTNFAASQLKLYYKHDTIRYFSAGMATTKVLILEGISGTGKTSLPYAIGKFFSGNATIVSVQPSWHDRADLVGYFNEFTKNFNETDFLSAIYEATYRQDPSVIILDEMNLARIEYYFAEFLSIMEMPDTSEWLIDVIQSFQDNDPKHLYQGKILVPQGLWFVGTANQDDSTFTITDKVYDRTITIDLNTKGEYFDAPMTESMHIPHEYLDLLFQQALTKTGVSPEYIDNLRKVDDFILDKFKVTFGNRIMRQMLTFIPVFVACGGTELEAVDFLLMSKILRKFNALNLSFLIKELNDLITLLNKLFGKGKCVRSLDYLNLLIKKN